MVSCKPTCYFYFHLKREWVRLHTFCRACQIRNVSCSQPDTSQASVWLGVGLPFYLSRGSSLTTFVWSLITDYVLHWNTSLLLKLSCSWSGSPLILFKRNSPKTRHLGLKYFHKQEKKEGNDGLFSQHWPNRDNRDMIRKCSFFFFLFFCIIWELAFTESS